LSTTLTKATATRLLEGETRILARDVPWALYEELVDSLHEGSPIRLAYDGKDMELMTTSKDHEQVGWLMARFAVAIIEELRIKFVPCGRSTWKEAKARRGIEADACYILAPAKVETVRGFRAAKLKDESDYPMADLAVEVDISRPDPTSGVPPFDRPAIYASLGVSELWRFDADTPVIERLGANGQYMQADSSGWLPVTVAQLRQWVVGEESSDFDEWSARMRAWIRKTYKKTGGRR
jgi:Uma2 family endonuclease